MLTPREHTALLMAERDLATRTGRLVEQLNEPLATRRPRFNVEAELRAARAELERVSRRLEQH